MSEEAHLILPKFDYHIDESDPDVLVLRRQDGSSVAALSARGATREGIVEAAREDYAALVCKDSGSPPSSAEGPGATNLRTPLYSPECVEG